MELVTHAVNLDSARTAAHRAPSAKLVIFSEFEPALAQLLRSLWPTLPKSSTRSICALGALLTLFSACGRYEAPTVCLSGRCELGDPPATAAQVCLDFEAAFLGDARPRFAPGADACDPGALEPAAYSQALAATNFVRGRLGLAPAQLRPSLHPGSQACAAMMSGTEELSHAPEPGWPCFSRAGAKAASQSNLSHNRLDFEWSMGRAVMEFFLDPGASNRRRVGHRRWLISPQLSGLGLGYHERRSAGQYGLCYNVLAELLPPDIRHPPVAYPSGTFPVQLLENGRSIMPWSVSFFEPLQEQPVRVSLFRVEGGRELAQGVKSAELNIDRYGDQAAVVFLPARAPRAGDYRYVIDFDDGRRVEHRARLVDCGS